MGDPLSRRNFLAVGGLASVYVASLLDWRHRPPHHPPPTPTPPPAPPPAPSGGAVYSATYSNTY